MTIGRLLEILSAAAAAAPVRATAHAGPKPKNPLRAAVYCYDSAGRLALPLRGRRPDAWTAGDHADVLQNLVAEGYGEKTAFALADGDVFPYPVDSVRLEVDGLILVTRPDGEQIPGARNERAAEQDENGPS